MLIKRVVLLIFSVFLFEACGTNPSMKTCYCYEEYKLAMNDCKYFVQHELSPSVKDRQYAKCIENKGFPNGYETCRQQCK
ncbi:MAG: hypothetical protein KAH84_02320 [Thiomargarita sp.]|nr:hypothetical protein [Thiomargarita sp.]